MVIGELRAVDPKSVGRYLLLGRLGAGGMGVVYLARSPGGRLVAIKVIRPELAEEGGFRGRFASEIAIARNVSGVYTAAVVDADPDAELPWLATAYVPGPSLGDAVDDGGPLPAGSVLSLAAGLAEALQAIHAAGVVHRDLKPSNVLLAADGPRVIDFGISRVREWSRLTTTGTVMGSPGFLSPEQVTGQDVGPLSDVFSLGAVLAFAATGEGPFGGGPAQALLYRVVNQAPDLSRVPARLRPVIEPCLAREPASRPTPAGLLAMLSAEVGLLTGDWLPEALTDSLRGYIPAPASPASPAAPPAPPAPEASASRGTATAASLGPAAADATADLTRDVDVPVGMAGLPDPGSRTSASGPARGALVRRRRRWPIAAGVAAAAAVAVVLALVLARIPQQPSRAALGTSPAAGGSTSASQAANASASAPAASAGLKTGLKVFVVPDNLGDAYFTTADSLNSGGAIAALDELGETGTETSGISAIPASQIPAIQAAIAKGANALIVSATDPTALCATLNEAMKRGITVVTYGSDAPACRDLFINEASTAQLGTSEVDVLAKEIGDSGQVAIVSAAASATNQNAWIGYMKQELKRYPKMQLVSVVYGNDDPATATLVTQGLLQQYPNLKGIISPTTVGIAAAAAVLDTAEYRGKVMLTGLGTPDEMKKYVADGTVKEFVLWNPAHLGYLAAYAAVEFASGKLTGSVGQSFTAGKLGSFTIGADQTIMLGPPTIFNSSNINNFNF